ncbi:hypothetical protein MTBLM5_10137 [Magnetospirillum sp. LM-5]|nr:hypothetical protein MTBLM5_10137 [Magnetospirillum sp. LM-5]
MPRRVRRRRTRPPTCTSMGLGLPDGVRPRLDGRRGVFVTFLAAAVMAVPVQMPRL